MAPSLREKASQHWDLLKDCTRHRIKQHCSVLNSACAYRTLTVGVRFFGNSMARQAANSMTFELISIQTFLSIVLTHCTCQLEPYVLLVIMPHASSICRIAAGGDKRLRQSRLGTDAADSFKDEDDALENEDFSGFDKPTRIEGEEGGGHVDPDPGDRDSVSLSDRQSHASLPLLDESVQYGMSSILMSPVSPSGTDSLFFYAWYTAVLQAFSITLF